MGIPISTNQNIASCFIAVFRLQNHLDIPHYNFPINIKTEYIKISYFRLKKWPITTFTLLWSERLLPLLSLFNTYANISTVIESHFPALTLISFLWTNQSLYNINFRAISYRPRSIPAWVYEVARFLKMTSIFINPS